MLDLQDRAGITVEQNQPQPDGKVGRLRSKAVAEVLSTVWPNLDETKPEAAQCADGECARINPSAKADGADQGFAVGRGRQARVGLHVAEEINKPPTAGERYQGAESTHSQRPARGRWKPAGERLQQRMVRPVRHDSPGPACL